MRLLHAQLKALKSGYIDSDRDWRMDKSVRYVEKINYILRRNKLPYSSTKDVV